MPVIEKPWSYVWDQNWETMKYQLLLISDNFHFGAFTEENSEKELIILSLVKEDSTI